MMRVSQIVDDDDSLDNNEDKGDSDLDLDNKNNEEEEEEEDIVNDDKATNKCPAKKKCHPHPSMSLYSQLLLLLSHYCLQERHHLLWL